MQVEVSGVPKADLKNYLRVATITGKKAALSYFYIGTDSNAINLLSGNFESGFVAENLETAKKIIRSEKFNNQVDAIIVDIPYDAKALRDFQNFLKGKGVHFTTPIIYSERQLRQIQVLGNDHIIDDIIDLGNWQFDFSTKISFLKKAKEYSLDADKEAQRIKPATCFYKRSFDVLISLSFILLTLPLFLLIALAIKLESRGPVFYNAKRAGRGFRIFKFYKFRTMEMNADKKIAELAHLNQYDSQNNGPQFFKISNDPRITKVGKFLRNTSLDELPQLFNVLKGDMSLVGNRPLPLYEASTLTTNEFVERFMAPAGITGLWQIKKRGKSDMSTEERISLDISYARKSNLLYDLWIMANTPGALLQKTDV
ncbi:MAG TPA: sugar transferase [Flavisolibacter sp.]|nr:sugar transferase [Flavisolibacter sp.]